VSGDKPLKAYQLSTREWEHSEIVFAASSKEARKGYAAVWDDVDFIDRRVKRAPSFDDATRPTPTISECLARGWWYECCFCDRMVYGDETELIVDDANGWIWCSAECKEKDPWQKELKLKEPQP
jgi:hypothetical protein